ncbi:hypothetical protein, partial [Rhizobium oryzihabitans]|uniref:hypothetical protein n=1 Tax=Rhizobium oryzihabitans TaxID=2267833 RepID=UPI004036AA76
SMASARLVLPVPAGPTIAMALVPWIVPSMSLSSCLPIFLAGKWPAGIARIDLNAPEHKIN